MVKDKEVTVQTCLDLLHQYETVDVTMKRFSEVQVHGTCSHDSSKCSQKCGTKQNHKQAPSKPNSSTKTISQPTSDLHQENHVDGEGDLSMIDQIAQRGKPPVISTRKKATKIKRVYS